MHLKLGVFPRIWWVAGFGPDLKNEPVPIRICDKPVVMFRTASGQPIALEDRCSHRAAPLSLGKCEGEIIRCPYHGLEFGAGGRCHKIPNQDRIPADAAVRSYPLVEKNKILYIWMGDPAEADPTRIPDNPRMDDPSWSLQVVYMKVECDWQLLVDNLLDLTHVAHVHHQTIGSHEDPASLTLNVTRHANSVMMERKLANYDCPPSIKAYEAVGIRFTGKVDRWWDVELVPGMLRYDSGVMNANTGAFTGQRGGGYRLSHLDALTPASKTSCHYFCFVQRDYLVGDADMDRRLMQMTNTVLAEDKVVVEEQQRRLMDEPERAVFDIASDAAQIQGRRLIETWL